MKLDGASLSVLILVGSASASSSTRTLAYAVEEGLSAHGVTVHVWTETVLPFVDGELGQAALGCGNAEVRRLIALADAVDGFVLASPVYHNSYSGALKNMLDHLSVTQFRYKPVGLLSHAGTRSAQALDQLRIVVR